MPIFKRNSNRKRIIQVSEWMILVGVFFISIFVFYFQVINKSNVGAIFFTDSSNVSMPILYQNYNGYMVNEMRAYREEKYRMVSNETLSVLEDGRKFNLIIKKNGSVFSQLEYEVRDKNTQVLIEKTVMDVPQTKDDWTNLTLNIQNLIKEGNTYTLIIKIDLIDKKAFYFTSIIYKNKTVLPDVLDRITSFTLSSFNKSEAAKTIVQYLETSPNRDLRQLHTVNIESSFEQITWADLDMKLVSDLKCKILQAQDYCYNINIEYMASCQNKNKKTENYIVKDEYVVRWDDKRLYVMKFNRRTDELINIENELYNEDNDRLYLGVTNPNSIQKVESENKKFFAIKNYKSIFLYNVDEKEFVNAYSNKIENKNDYEKISQETELEIIEVSDVGDITFLSYGYNMKGNFEGYIGLSIMKYICSENRIEEMFFIPIITTFQNLKYDLDKFSTFRNNILYFKSYDKLYSVDTDTAEVITIAQNIEETKSGGSSEGKYFAFNTTDKFSNKNITIINIEDNTQETIKPEEGQMIEVITFINDDLFYGIANESEMWTDSGKIIGRPYNKIQVLNLETGEEKEFEENMVQEIQKEKGFTEDKVYFYNCFQDKSIIRYNKYGKIGNKYIRYDTGVIQNTLKTETENVFSIKEEYTKDKLRITYIPIETKGNDKLKFKNYKDVNVREQELRTLETETKDLPDIFYVYTNGTLINKLKILSDGISQIRDSFGYVKLNDSITCYNRSNKANVSYLRMGNQILENVEGFEENFYFTDNDTLVMNVTGATERDLEYYVSLGEKCAVYYDDEFRFFVTGYDNINYVLEYLDKDKGRVLTPRAEVHSKIVDEGYIVFAQLEKLE